MKLVRTTDLHKNGRVYEVDLCDVGGGRGVVNFRHGTRGRLAKEGTHTVHPLPMQQAERLFDTMVQRKLDDGYVPEGQSSTDRSPTQATQATPATTPTPTPTASAGRERRILRYLKAGGAPHWPIHRIIWRAGELRLSAAAPLLLRHCQSDDPLVVYSAAWALARSRNPSALNCLRRLRKSGPTDALRRVATEGMRALLPKGQRRELLLQFARRLPASVVSAREQGVDAVVDAVHELVADAPDRWSVLEDLYLVDDPIYRGALAQLLRELPLGPGTMRPFRHVYKASELRGDGLIFGLCARLISIRPPFANRPEWRQHVYIQGVGTVDLRAELKRPDSRVAWLQVTRRWFQRRVWRHLRRLGELNSPEYVVLATGLLAAYHDQDGKPEYRRTAWSWQLRRSELRGVRGPWHAYWALCHVLWQHDERLEQASKMLGFYQVSDVQRDRRDEAFPALWDARPDALVHLLCISECAPVHESMARALRSQPQSWSAVAVPQLVGWLGCGYSRTQALAADIAVERYEPADPDAELVLAMGDTPHEPARAVAHGWIRQGVSIFVERPGLLASLSVCDQADTRGVVREVLTSYPMSPDQAFAVFNAILSAVLRSVHVRAQAVLDVSTLLSTAFLAQARAVPLTTVRDLLHAPSEPVQTLGARLLVGHHVSAVDLPPELLHQVMYSQVAAVRGVGIRLFAELPDELLLGRREQLFSLASSEYADVRRAIGPVLARLSLSDAGFSADLLSYVLVRLRSPGDEAVLIDLFALARDHLRVQAISGDMVYDLLCSVNEAAWRLAVVRLEGLTAMDLSVQQLVRLADHDWVAVRAGCKALLADRRADVPDVLGDVLHGLVDASWADARQWGFEFLGGFDGAMWSPELLVEVCDSTKPDVQAFGRKLITRFFEEEHGPRYLLRLAQHPSADMQLYATSYLDRFAAGHYDRLGRLELFFVTVLTGVNKGRVAKARVFSLLAAEAQRDQQTADLVARMLGRVSATISVRDRARAIEVLLDIALRWPDVSVPVVVKPLAARGDRAV